MKNKKNIIIVVLLVVILVSLLIEHVANSKEFKFDEDYINTEVLWNVPNVVVKDILLCEDFEKNKIVLCSTQDNLIMLLVLDEDYQMIQRTSFNLEMVSKDITTMKSNYMPLLKKTIYYNIFFDPNIDNISVQGRNLKVNEFNYNYNGNLQSLGFWFFVE